MLTEFGRHKVILSIALANGFHLFGWPVNKQMQSTNQAGELLLWTAFDPILIIISCVFRRRRAESLFWTARL